MKSKRIAVQIMGDILRLGEAGKTEIAIAANVGYPRLEQYLAFLIEKDFICMENHRPVPMYRTTPEGQELLLSIDRVTEALGLATSIDSSIR